MGVVVVQLRGSSTRWCFMLFLVYLVTNGFLVVDAQKMHPSEVEALHSIRSHLVDPFKNLKSWSSGDPCQANWTGVLCSPLKDDGYLHVQALQLLNMNLSGTLAPEVGQLSYMEIFDIMWNRIAGTIPKEIGNVKSLQLLLVNGNLLTGPLPDEIGLLPYLDRLQIDENYITGPIPKSFGNLNNTKHLHMNNNSLSGQIPAEIARMPSLVHLLLDNNNLSGYLPSELASLPVLRILQLDNNQFTGRIPYSYSNMTTLLKMSLRNCSLQGTVPDLSGIVQLSYIDLSWNHLTGPIPTNKLSTNITTIDLSHNNLNGTVPLNFSGLPHLQKLSFANNRLSGSISTSIWQLSGLSDQLIVDFQNNSLSNVSDVVNLPANVILRLQGNPLCSNTGLVNLSQICGFLNDSGTFATNPPATTQCLSQSCPYGYEYVPSAPVQCFCAAPIKVGFRLKSPSISIFPPYVPQFEIYLTSGLSMDIYQLYIDSYDWEEGPRLRMYLKIFPSYSNDSHSSTFNTSDVRRIKYMFTGWKIPDSPLFGPKELLNFTLEGPYSNLMISSAGSTWGTGLIVAIVVGVIAVVLITFAAILLLAMRRHLKHYHALSRKRQSSTIPIKIDDVKVFSYDELASATDNFCTSAQVGRGGYGTVYKGTLSDGSTVAIKRAEAGSLQGEREFFTEIELLSRLHHRNLVSLVGYCNEEAEQMLVYEFIENGTLRDHLSAKKKNLLSFPVRLRIALGAARGIQYLHHEVDPPVFHRDIKASNILLDSRFIAKVADFGLSKLAPVPDLEGNRPGHVSTVVRGTPGYLDPEYFLTNKLTDRSDVYSLGVVFLELLTGLLPISHGKNLVREVRDACREGALLNIMDPDMDSYPIECAEPFVKLAIRCCEDEPEKRPPITEIVRELESIFVMIPETVVTPTISGALSETTMSSTVQTPLFSGPIVTRSAELSSDISETRSFNVVIHHSSPR